MPSILCIGDEPALNRSRAAVLRTTGCDVMESSSSGALLLLQNHRFDMALMCHTVPAASVVEIIHAAHRLSPPPKLVMIDSPFGVSLPAPDGVMHIDPYEGPRLLAEQVCHSLELPAPLHPAATAATPPSAAMPLSGAVDLRRHIRRAAPRQP